MTSTPGEHQHLWAQIIADDPDHTQRYIDRWVAFREQGRDLDGEARLIDAMAERGSAILDAGCGTGRTGGWLLERGHRVTGVDLDPGLIAQARADHPDGDWHVGDLARLDEVLGLPEQPDDLQVMAGNVLTFVAPALRQRALEMLRARLAPHGRLVIGFGQGRGYSVEEFREHVAAAGLAEDLLLATWDLRPWTPEADFLVAVLRHP